MKTEVILPRNGYPARVRNHVSSKLEGLARFFEGTVSVRAHLQKEHGKHRVELLANVRRGVVLVVESRDSRMSAALDDSIERMGRVLTRHKEKIKLARRKGQAKPSRGSGVRA